MSDKNMSIPVTDDNKIFIQLFEKQVALTPGNIALVSGDECITYLELNNAANRLGHFLKARAVQEESLVPVCLQRSPQLLITILAILKTGAAYVPVDPEYPADYVRFLLEDTGSELLITDHLYIEQLQPFVKTCIDLDRCSEAIAAESGENVVNMLTSGNLAYVIYTSGSTGKPKGVMIEHGNLMNYLANCIKYYVDKDAAGPGSYLNLPGTFDASVTSMFVPLLTGTSVVLAPAEIAEMFRTGSFSQDEAYQFLKMTPSHLQLLNEATGSSRLGFTKRLILGGEALQYSQLKFLFQHQADLEIINEYGPTEATVGCCIYRFYTKDNPEHLQNSIPIGKPLDHVTLYIVDEDDDLMPIGVTGELYIGGAGVARGYLNQPALTSEKFIPDFFSKKQGARLYKTGDRARRLQDGNIEFMGRADEQVKVRGYRIELGEIEALFNEIEAISGCCTVTRKDSMGVDKLVSYYTLDADMLIKKEKELYTRQLASWKELYETEYGKTENSILEDEEFNIVGWGDSFTRADIPAYQMVEWLDDITTTIMQDKAEKVLEIGCGTGLIYYRLSGKVKKYYGADLSSSAVRQITKRIEAGKRSYSKTHLQVNPAHLVILPDGETVDTVVINSVIQYFPGQDYLTDIIEKSIGFLGGTGRIILGDVRDNRLLKSFKARLSLEKISTGSDIRDFEWMIDQELLAEEELCFSPAYFYHLRTVFPAITHIDLQWKKGDAVNELTLYRYTVILYVGIQKEKLPAEWIDMNGKTSFDNIILAVKNRQPVIALKNAVNPRLKKEIAINKGIEDASVMTIADLFRYNTAYTNVQLEDIDHVLQLANQNGYQTRLLVNADHFKINIVFSLMNADFFIEQFEQEHTVTGNALTNIPLFNEISFLLQKDIRNFLKNRLPNYMVPADLIALKQMPLTANGKTDRKFLSTQEIINKNNKSTSFALPASALENSLAEIWQELLGVERVGTQDDFFEMGGHSLLAVRVVSAIRKKMGREVSLQDFFLYPTIAQLAIHLQKAELDQQPLLPAILPQPRTGEIPLSFAQERLWFIDKLQGSVQYHMPWIFRLKGNLDIAAIEKSFREIVYRHEILRTVIKEKDGTGFQEIRSADGWKMNVVNEQEITDRYESVEAYTTELVAQPYDLSEDWIFRVTLIQVSLSEFIIIAVLHHIAFDGWSVAVISKEFTALYQHFSRQKPLTLSPLPVQYADYATWQRVYLNGEILHKKLNYWKKNLSGIKPLQLPFNYKKRKTKAGAVAGEEVTVTLGLGQKEKLLRLSNAQGCTLFMTMLAAFKIVLYRYTGQKDICVGTPVAGRQQQDLEGLIGFFVNTLAIRDEVDPEMGFNELLKQVKITTLAAFENQEVPFEKVVDVLEIERDIERNPVFQVLFAMQNTPEVPALELDDVVLEPEENTAITVRFELNVIVEEIPDGIHIKISYLSDLFEESTISRMLAHYINILESVLQDRITPVGKIGLLSLVEKKQLLVDFNTNSFPIPDTTLIRLFEDQVLKTPDHIALEFEESFLTYKELDEKANMLGHYLQSYGIDEKVIVPICFNRSVNMIVAILGVLKTGASYMPLDPEYPMDRIKYMLEDVSAAIGLCDKANKQLLAQAGLLATITEMDSMWDEIKKEAKTQVIANQQADNLVYIIYTSGSTGKPKGVQLQHASLVNFVLHQSRVFNIRTDERVLQFYNYCFDPSVEQIFLPLINGAVCVLVSNKVRLDQQEFEFFLTDKRITHLQATPSFLYNLKSAKYGGLRRVIAGGEVCSIELAQRWNGICDFYNKYGPTETAITATEYFCADAAAMNEVNSLPIGKPVSNTFVYLTDAMGQLVPIGVTGEINIGGVQVARGYLNRPELNAEKFVPDIFRNEPGKYMYKTGDLARWLPDGNIEYLGRNDEQIKIRGYRVEPGEVESVLQQHPSVTMCAVTGSIDKASNNRLVAYIVPAKDYNKNVIKEFLESKLPLYMVPAIYVTLQTIPVTSTGKADKKLLPAADAAELIENDFVAPASAIEIQLAQIWQNILGVGQVGKSDNFFELGGHSLLVVKVVSAVRQELNIEISVMDIFVNPTIGLLAVCLQNQQTNILLPVITHHEAVSNPPLSFSQERLWFIDRLQGTLDYHMPWVFRLQGTLDVAALESSLRSIVERHQILRTVIHEQNGIPYQVVLPVGDWQLLMLSASEISIRYQSTKAYIRAQILQPYDLSADMMLRVQLIRESPEEHVLFVMLHHIAFDGQSVLVLIKEIEALYNSYTGRFSVAGPAEDSAIQYADYAIWQREYFSEDILSKKLSYWKDTLRNLTPLRFPVNPETENPDAFEIGQSTRILSKPVRDGLAHLSRQHGATLFMSLLAGFNALLYRYSGEQDICIGSPVSDRAQHGLEGLIGFFVNTLCLRNKINPESGFTSLLTEVKATTLAAFEHLDTPFEKIVEAVVVERDRNRNPLFQVMISMHEDVNWSSVDLDKVAISMEDWVVDGSMFIDLGLSITDLGEEGLKLRLSYRHDLYASAWIDQLLAHYEQLLCIVSADPHKPLGKLVFLSEGEQSYWLDDINSTQKVYNGCTGVVELIEDAAATYPDHIALKLGSLQMSYRELDKRANQLAHDLRSKGVGPDVLVPVYTSRSIEMIVAMLGVLKAGGAYVPVDITYPAERVAYILKDTSAKIVITTGVEASLIFLQFPGLTVVDLLLDKNVLDELPETGVLLKHTPSNLSYVIYTSGSTGTPKGVLIRHASMYNYVCNFCNYFSIDSQDRMIQTASISFDTSVEEIFPLLSSGGMLVIAEDNRDFASVSSLIAKEEITVLSSNPSFINYYNQHHAEPCKLRVIVSGGEALKSAHIDNLYKRIDLYNSYGPTESTVCATYYRVQQLSDNIPIGKPLSNVRTYILNADKQLQPIGVPGELFIGGVQLSAGYLNNALLTDQSFIPDPYHAGCRIYATGDICRLLSNGNIEYIGREDEQINIRGYRIEPGEIESLLLKYKGIKECLVTDHEDAAGQHRLVCFLCAEETVGQDELIDYLKELLPVYMVPSVFVMLGHLPLTENGKINKQVLKQTDLGDHIRYKVYKAPRNEMEMQMVNIWQDLLAIKQIGVLDNFFELGGNSIITIQAASRIRKYGYEIQVADFFTFQTIEKISAMLVERAGMKEKEINLQHGKIDLLPIQRWYLQNTAIPGHQSYNTLLLSIDKIVSPQMIRSAIDVIFYHNDSLRLIYYKGEDGDWEQSYTQLVNQMRVKELDVSDTAAADFIVEQCREYYQGIDFSRENAVKILLITTPESHENNQLFIAAPIVMMDLVSWSILVKEIDRTFTAQINNEELPGNRNSASFFRWQEALKKYAGTKRVHSQREYWARTTSYYKPFLIQPEIIQTYSVTSHNSYQTSLNEADTAELTGDICYVYLTNVSDILLTGLTKELCTWLNEKQVVIGMETSCRDHVLDEISIAGTIGVMLTQYPLLLEYNSGIYTAELIKNTKEKLRQLPDKGLGYAAAQMVNGEAEKSWDILFRYMDKGDEPFDRYNTVKKVEEPFVSDFRQNFPGDNLILISCAIEKEKMQIQWDYRSDMIAEDAIVNLAHNYMKTIKEIISHCAAQKAKGITEVTPADYGLAGSVSYQELDKFLNKDGDNPDNIMTF